MAEVMNATQAKRTYKDSLFRKLFGEKEKLLSLYNAVNGTSYTNADDLRINTLDNAVYLNVKNDISFIFGFELTLYEAQSTYCGNMPFRFLIYSGKLMQKELAEQSIYVSKVVSLPAPVFVVFYNGKDNKPERWIEKLSDAYTQKTNDPNLELKVLNLNINLGNNQALMEQCRTLKEYAIYVNKVRKYAETMELRDAVEFAVNESIKEGVLTEFLTRYRAEAIWMSILEYDEEREMKLMRKAEYEFGRTEGKAEVIVEMIRKKMQNNKDIDHIVKDLDLEKELVTNIYNLIREHPQSDNADIARLL